MSSAEEREVDRVAEELARRSGEMQKHSDELAGQIESVRQEFENKRSDKSVVGLPHEPDSDAEPDGDNEDAAEHDGDSDSAHS